MKRIAAYILDLAFDGSQLGYPRLRDGIDLRCLAEEDSQRLVNMMEGVGKGFGGDMLSLAQELIVQYGGQPIRMLGLYNGIDGRLGAPETVTTLVSTHLFSAKSPKVWRTNELRMDACDNHLHGGLAFDMHALQRSLVERVSPIGVQALGQQRWASTVGDVDGALAVSVLRWASWVFASLEETGWEEPLWFDSLTPSREMFLTIRDGTFWPMVRQACFLEDKEVGHRSSDFDVNLRALDGTRPAGIPTANTSDILLRSIKNNRPWLSDYSSWQNEFMMGLIRLSALVFSLGVARHGDGLEVFQKRVENAGRLKKIILYSRMNGPADARRLADERDAKRAMYREAFHNLSSSFEGVYRFGGCELRQNLHDGLGVGRGVTTVLDEIQESILPAWEAAESFLREDSGSGHQFRFCTPLAFQRMPVQGLGASSDPYMRQPGAEFQEAAITAKAIACMADVTGAEFLGKAVGGVDVSGIETWSQNWPYVSAMNWLRASVDIRLNATLHAGESFAYRMRGLRMIGECFLGDSPPDRIGHALALSSRMSASIEDRSRRLPIPKRELVSDLCWLHQSHDGLDSCIDLIVELTQPRNPLVSIDPQAWVEGFSSLHLGSLMSRVSVPVAPVSGGRWSDVLAGKACWTSARENWPGGAQVFEASYLLAWDSYDSYRVVECGLGSPAEEHLQSRVLRYLVEKLDEAERVVKELLRQHETIVEVCPTSNLRLSGLDRYSDHPIWEWLREGLSVSVNSDDPLIFLSSGGDELERLGRVSQGSDMSRLNAALGSLESQGHCQSSQVTADDSKVIAAALASRRWSQLSI